MSLINALTVEGMGVGGFITPQTINTAAGTVSTAVMNAGNFSQVNGAIYTGTVAAGAPVIITLTQGQDSGMTGAKPVLVYTAAANASDKLFVFSVRGQDFDANNLFGHARLDLAHDDATGGIIGAMLWGSIAKHEPASNFNVANVVVIPYPPTTS